MATLRYSTPGAYYERVDAGVPVTSPVRMDVAAFVGIAERGPLHTPVPVESWRQFAAYFGDVTGAGYLAYVVRGFFENGGARCWIVRIASDAAMTADAIAMAGGAPAWSINASSAGVWGNNLSFEVEPSHRSQTATVPTLSRPEFSTVGNVAGFDRGTHVRVVFPDGTTTFRVVSMVDADTRRLYWVHPDPTLRLPYDSPLLAPDPNTPLVLESVEYTILVRELGLLTAVYDRLSLIPENPRYGPAVLPPLAIDPTQPSSWNIAAAPEPVVVLETRSATAIATLAPLDVAAEPLTLEGGADGLAALTVDDFVGEEVSPLDSDFIRRRKQRGLRALDLVGEVAAVAVPDIHIHPIPPPERAPLPPCVPDPCLPPPPPGSAVAAVPAVGDLPPVFGETAVFRVQNELVLHCERHADRIALIDPPFATVSDDRLGITPIQDWRRRFDSRYAALYFPWLDVVEPMPAANRLTRLIPPCGHVAGSFAGSDRLVGVHKAPANTPLNWVQATSVAIGSELHGELNDAGINAIRAMAGRGLRILGARLLSSDPDWRFLNVRRLFIMIERTLRLSCRWAVFEPNSSITRAKLHLSLISFLIALWQRGALVGRSPQEAFFVKCAADNNPAETRDLGELIAEVGIAPSVPFEFVVVRIGREDNQFQITEVAAAGGVR
jgi:Bacteriophage tail sheath protein